MSVTERLRWWFGGEVARVVVEEYDGGWTALLLPVITGALAYWSAWAFEQALAEGSGVIAGVFGLIATFLVVYALVSAVATYVYARARIDWDYLRPIQ